MQGKVVEGIKKCRVPSDQNHTLLFTGHSAGGAIAQIFYALSMSENAVMHDLVEGRPISSLS